MVFRLRLHARPTVRGLTCFSAVDPGDFVMMRHMMYGLERRAEALDTVGSR